MSECVKVIVRKRPLSQNEVSKNCKPIIQVFPDLSQTSILNPKSGTEKSFTFDNVYGEDCTQRQIYDESAFPLVESVLEGYNGTIFAYGQTGCGKTHTMLGDSSSPEAYGIIPNSFQHIFGSIQESQQETCFVVTCSYCEIYNEEIRDLLDFDLNQKLELKESKDKGIFIKNLSSQVVKSIKDIENAMALGNQHRVTKGTSMNERSSRSHAIFTIYIERCQTIAEKQTIRAGKLNLVDLAGSERQKKTGAIGDRLKEAIEINLSLSALGNVISALVDGSTSHIPYRDSKLTRLLQDSLGGNTKTVMIAVVSPADYNYDESLSTLRYASRAKFIKNKPRVNEDPKDALLREYSEEISRLKQLLEGQETPMAKMVIVGGETQDPRLQEQRALHLKLKKQRKREKKLRKEKAARERELIEKETNYQNLIEENESLKKALGSSQAKYEAAMAEIEDINREHESEKETILENVRDLEHEYDFLMKATEFLIPKKELRNIRKKAKFDEINNTWKIPPFVYKHQSLVFPKLQNKYLVKEMVQNEHSSKTVVYENKTETHGSLYSSTGNEGFKQPKVAPRKRLILDPIQHYSKSIR